jgi:hypothetical protein
MQSPFSRHLSAVNPLLKLPPDGFGRLVAQHCAFRNLNSHMARIQFRLMVGYIR